MIMLSVKNGSFSFRNDKPLIQNLDFSVSSGQILAILGPNGIGKTTLLRCITGLLPWDSGKTFLDQTETGKIPQSFFWKRVSYVPQSRGTVSSVTTEEMILLGLTGSIGVFSSPGKAELERVYHRMEQLNITHLIGKRCTEISGGELQMVLIARALISDPELLILDEPESGLDFRNQMIVLDTLSSLAERGMCCIFNTHYPDHALLRADSALLLSAGGKWNFGKTAEVITEASLTDVFGIRAVIQSYTENGKTYPAIIPVSLCR